MPVADTVVLAMQADVNNYLVNLNAANARFNTVINNMTVQSAQATRNIERSFRGLGLAFTGFAAAMAVDRITKWADAWTSAANKLTVAGIASQDLAYYQEQLFDIAQRSRSGFEETVALYQRLAIASNELTINQSQLLRVTETVSKALTFSGATAEEARSSITQFSQALASGVLQGDELRSIRENAPLVAQAIAREFGVTIGELKQLGKEGELTAGRIAKAVLSISEDVDKMAETTRLTFQQAGLAIENALIRFLGKVNDAAGGSDKFAEAVHGLMEVLDRPEVIQAAVDLVTLLIDALRLAAEGMAFLARNTEIMSAAAGAFIALRLADVIRGIMIALSAGNPIMLVVAAAGLLLGVLVDLTDGFGLWAEKIDYTQRALDTLTSSQPEAKEFLDTLLSGSNAAAAGFENMGRAARQAAIDILRLMQVKLIERQQPFEERREALVEREHLTPSAQVFAGAGSLGAQVNRRTIGEITNEIIALNSELDSGLGSVENYDRRMAELTDTFGESRVRIAQEMAQIVGPQRELANEVDILRQQEELLEKLNEEITAAELEEPITGGAGGAGDGDADKTKTEKLKELIRALEAEVAGLGLTGVALKEHEILTRASEAALDDFNNKLRESAELTAVETEHLKELAKQLEVIPRISEAVMEQNPAFARMKGLEQLNELREALTDPEIAQKLAEQGISLEMATDAIDKQEEALYGYAEAVTEVGNELAGAAQDADTLGEALGNMALKLAELLAMAAFGQGPLGNLFNQLLNVGAGGLVGLAFGGAAPVPAGAVAGAGLSPIQGMGIGRAVGGPVVPGVAYEVGEQGRERFVPHVPGLIMPNMGPTERGPSGPNRFEINVKGAHGDKEIMRAIQLGSEAAYRKAMRDSPTKNMEYHMRFS